MRTWARGVGRTGSAGVSAVSVRPSTCKDRKSRGRPGAARTRGKRNVLETFLGPLAKSLQNVTPVDFLLLARQKPCDVLQLFDPNGAFCSGGIFLTTCQTLLAISEQKCLTGDQF